MDKKIAIVGGGPAGLYFAVLTKILQPNSEITVWERNAPDDTFGFGVVFSDETLTGIENSDPDFYGLAKQQFASWSDIDVFFGGEKHTIGGQGFSAISRKDLLLLLQSRARDLGVSLIFNQEAPDTETLSREYDLVVGADGINSKVRSQFAESFQPSLDGRKSKFMWLGVNRAFEAFTFFVKETQWGVIQVHAYPYSENESTFLVEMHEDVWKEAGFDKNESQHLPPGVSDDESVFRIAEMFSEELDGAQLLTNNSKWLTFNTVRNEKWSHDNIVLLGDAAHTAHFSIGSGTKLALEDALVLAASLFEQPSVESALDAYEIERRPVVLSLQRAAQASLEWFENIDQYTKQEPLQFAFNLLTRSRRITFENLALRDPGFAEQIQLDFASRQVNSANLPAMFQPIKIGNLEIKNRIIVSPMDQYMAKDGVVGDFHLVHLGGKAIGGAGLVMTEMIAPSAQGRISPADAGLYTDEQGHAWKRIVDFVHDTTTAKIGAQIGHSGRKGSTKRMWEGIDDPVETGGWEVVGPSPIPYGPKSKIPREVTRLDMDQILSDHVAATKRAALAGFDLLELHAAHGYLLSSFISPISNHREDAYGGSLENRLRYPLEVFDAMRKAWPSDRPLIVRISAHDWIPGGLTDEDSVDIASAFIKHGADAIDVSAGQISKSESPLYGRSFQTPFADKIRNRVACQANVPVITVGAISTYDDVNSIILAGRADLVALGRSHLYNPHWTLHAAAEQEIIDTSAEWILPYKAGRRKPPSARTDAIRPRLELNNKKQTISYHSRWINGQTTFVDS